MPYAGTGGTACRGLNWASRAPAFARWRTSRPPTLRALKADVRWSIIDVSQTIFAKLCCSIRAAKRR
jgi:hypothetical protein